MSNSLGFLIERNLLEVFDQRNSKIRESAIKEIYEEDCTFFENGESVVGRDSLNARVDRILQGAPGFVFRMTGPSQVNHDHGRLSWAFGPEGGDAVVKGMDVAVFRRGRICALYTFLDTAPPMNRREEQEPIEAEIR